MFRCIDEKMQMHKWNESQLLLYPLRVCAAVSSLWLNGACESKSTLKGTGHRPLKHRNPKPLKAQKLCRFLIIQH